MNSRFATLLITVGLVFAWSAATILAQTDSTLAFGLVHGTADAPESVLAFTSAKGARLLALADKKGDYRLALEPGQYCVSVYTASGDPVQLSAQQQKCIDVTARKDVRFDVTISRVVAVNDVPARTIEQPGEIEAQVLAGKIVNASSLPIPEVLIELLSSDGKRIEAVLTDSKGKFVMKPRAPWVYPLRVSKPGFDTLLLKVRLSKTGKRELALTMTASQ